MSNYRKLSGEPIGADDTAAAHLWKVILTDFHAAEPAVWEVYVVSDLLPTVADMAFVLAGEDTPDIKSVEYVGMTVFIDPRCVVNIKSHMISLSKID